MQTELKKIVSCSCAVQSKFQRIEFPIGERAGDLAARRGVLLIVNVLQSPFAFEGFGARQLMNH